MNHPTGADWRIPHASVASGPQRWRSVTEKRTCTRLLPSAHGSQGFPQASRRSGAREPDARRVGCGVHASHVDEQSLGSADHPKASATSSSAMLPWDELAAGLRGRLIGPLNPGYPAARLVYDPRFDDVRPRAIVIAATAGDVTRTILFARDHALAFAARCGGHSYGGYSLSDGIVIDVSAMATIRPSTDTGTVTIGAGAKVIDVAAGLATVGAVIPVGTCATVGISGLTLGGGQGVVGRRFGLTCDSLRAARVVLADGRIVTCDPSKEADLFWALRGAGGGNLGVVTSFTFASYPLDGITAFSMSWPWSDAADVAAAWQTWGPSAPAPRWS